MDGEKISIVPYILTINQVEITLRERQVMNGIQQIGFAGTVISGKAIDLFRELQRSFPVILKIE
jgi:hypothetical protein